MLRVSYTGLGLVGKYIARNFLKAGFPLTLYNRSVGAMVVPGRGVIESACDWLVFVDNSTLPCR